MTAGLDPAGVALVVCAAPLAERSHDLAGHLVAAGYSVTVTPTPAAGEWVDGAAIETATSCAAKLSPRRPGEPRTTPKPANVVVAPLTFNTLNLWAIGASNNRALGVLNDALGTGAAVVAVPIFADRLWAHPALAGHVDMLRAAGVTFLDVRDGREGSPHLASGTAPQLAQDFDPAWLLPYLTSPRP